MFRSGFQQRFLADQVERLVFDGGLPAILRRAFFKLHHFVHDELPIARRNLLVGGGKIRAGDLQVHGGLLFRFVAGVKQADGGGAVARVEAVLLARHVIMNVIPVAFFPFVEPVAFSHNCVHSDELMTVDLDSGREPVGVKQRRPELNRAGTSAGTR